MDRDEDRTSHVPAGPLPLEVGAGEAALSDGLSRAVSDLLPALERFLRFDTLERTASERALWSSRLDESLPRVGQGAEAVLAILREVVIPHGLRVGAPGFSGWVATAPTTIPAATHLASAVAGSLCVGIQSFNELEDLARRWLAELLRLPSSWQGLFTSGGSVANLIGLGAARQYAAERRGVNPSRDGLEGLGVPRLYASSEVHHCIHRAAGVLGLGRKALVEIPTDRALRMDVAALRRQVEEDLARGCTPVAVVATAGTINSGAIDPLPELVELCRGWGVWLHVDGAYGLLGVLDPEVAPQYGDLSQCDSLVVDPHKWLATSMGCASIFVRGGGFLERAFALEPAVYVERSQPAPNLAAGAPATSQFDGFGHPFHHLGVEHSLPSRGVEAWAVLKEIGVEGLTRRIQRHNRFARHLAERIRGSPVLQLMAPVTLSTCCFRYVPESLRGRSEPDLAEKLNLLNREVLRRIREQGRCAPSGTEIDGAFVIRSCFINPRTVLADVDALAHEAETCGARAWAALGSS